MINEKKNIRHPYISDETLCIDKTAFVGTVTVSFSVRFGHTDVVDTVVLNSGKFLDVGDRNR